MMNGPSRGELYRQRALEARRAGQFVDIDWMLPSLLIHRGPDNEQRWTCGEAATQLSTYADEASLVGCSLQDYILAKAQEQ